LASFPTSFWLLLDPDLHLQCLSGPIVDGIQKSGLE
jgi:hypothetical protein